MYARIITVTLPAGTAKTDLLYVHDRLLAVLKPMTGFVRYYAMIDRKSAKAVAISYWQTEADMNQRSELLEQLRSAYFTEIGALDHSVAEYEVALHF